MFPIFGVAGRGCGFTKWREGRRRTWSGENWDWRHPFVVLVLVKDCADASVSLSHTSNDNNCNENNNSSNNNNNALRRAPSWNAGCFTITLH